MRECEAGAYRAVVFISEILWSVDFVFELKNCGHVVDQRSRGEDLLRAVHSALHRGGEDQRLEDGAGGPRSDSVIELALPIVAAA